MTVAHTGWVPAEELLLSLAANRRRSWHGR